jgi:hypothetical protein
MNVLSYVLVVVLRIEERGTEGGGDWRGKGDLGH